MKTFIEWLNENTVSQLLKQQKNIDINKLKKTIESYLNNYEFVKTIKEKLILINFIVKICIEENKSDKQEISRITNKILTNYGDFISSNWNVLKSKFNNPAYNMEQLDQDSKSWHDHIATKKASIKKASIPSEEYPILINFQDGYKWVSLERGYCSQEARAMGHCGNSGAKKGDNMLSLRDPKGNAHLTFIVNNGRLGESKGRANQKPIAKYFPYIIELLKSPSIQVVVGGGYKPENNFNFSDLSEQDQKTIKSLKPNIDNYIRFSIEKRDFKSLSEILNISHKDLKIDGENITLIKYEEIEDLKSILYNKNKSNWWEYLNGDNYTQHEHLSYMDVKYYIDEKSEELIWKLAKKEGYQGDDLKEAYDEIYIIKELLHVAYEDAANSGAQGAAWKSFKNQLKKHSEDNFWIDMDGHSYQLKISINDLTEFFSKKKEEIEYYGDIENYLLNKEEFTFDIPYYGFEDFDKKYFNELLILNLNIKLK